MALWDSAEEESLRPRDTEGRVTLWRGWGPMQGGLGHTCNPCSCLGSDQGPPATEQGPGCSGNTLAVVS